MSFESRSEPQSSVIVPPWTGNEVIYQIYPRSFQDTNGDGNGDLRGISQHVDYLANTLRVDGFWLSPIYPSPWADGGYDVADYRRIDSRFSGNPNLTPEQEFQELLDNAHQHRLRLMMDYVLNHTSDEHEWFLDSRSGKDNPKRDWYLWQPPKNGQPPNNWLSGAGGSIWEFDQATGEYYLHSYHKKQPDLNWRNPAVVKEIMDMLEYWFGQVGVDGARMDVLHQIIKDSQYRDEAPNLDYIAGKQSPSSSQQHLFRDNQPEYFDLAKQVVAKINSHGAFMVSEVHVPPEDRAKLSRIIDSPLHAPFNFDLINASYDAQDVKRRLETTLSLQRPEDPIAWAIGNHDSPRAVSRWGGQMQARQAAMIQFGLPGMVFMYQGEEIGMGNVRIPPEKRNDQFDEGREFGRDSFRTPMQWDDSPNAGFCPEGVEPWLPVEDDYKTRNVHNQMANPGSMLAFYRQLIELKRSSSPLQNSVYQPLEQPNDQIYTFQRAYDKEGQGLLIVHNLSNRPQVLSLSDNRTRLILNTYLDRTDVPADLSNLQLRPHESSIIDISQPRIVVG